MGYFLVALKEGPAHAEEPQQGAAHLQFIDSLIERRLVLLGGDLSRPVEGIAAAYVLCCDSLAEAAAIAAEDPYSVHGIYTAETVEWDLVGIDPSLIDPKLAQ